MGLQVWLPLTKDLHNQGLTNVNFNNTGITQSSTGKLGGSYYFVGQVLAATNFSIDSNAWSICYWVYYTSIPGSSNFYQVTLNGSSSTDYLFMVGGYSSNGTTGVFRCNMAGDCGTINRNIWYHVCATYDGSKCRLYVNGELLNTFNITVNANKTNLTIGGRSNNAANTAWTGTSGYCYLNDVRIYDNCLSEKEIKEIAKGLIVHFPLNRQGWGQENLLVDTYNWSTLTNANTVSEGYWYNNGGIAVRGYDNINNITYCKIWHSDSSSWTRYSRQYITMQPNTYYTVSILCRINTDIAHLSIRNDRSGVLTFFAQNVELTNKNWEWKFFTAKTHTNTSQEPFTIYAQVNSDGVLSSDTSIDIAMVKLEKGSIATPWCPNSSDALYTTMNLNSTIEYDGSGFQNNGTRNGTFTWSSDTPNLYNVSTDFNTNNCITINPLVIDMNNLTFSLWVKWDAFNSYSRIWDFGYAASGGGYCCFLMNDATNGSIKLRLRNSSGTEVLNKTFITASLNTWYHIAFTLSGTTCKIYVNGDLNSTSTLSSNIGIATFNYPYIGKSNWSTDALLDGKLSDFRIYTTTLSDKDIKSLYQNSAYIDSNDNIYGQIR